MRLAVPDLISNSYFPAISAVELGDFAQQGLDVRHELIFPVDKSYQALRDGEVDFIGGSAHAVLSAFPAREGAKLLCALVQGMYWFLVMRADEGHARGDLGAVKGKKIGATPWVDYGLKRMLQEVGIDIEHDEVDVASVPDAVGPGVSFGATAARALEDRLIDGFWANGMGAELAVTRGVGTIVVDVRGGMARNPRSTTRSRSWSPPRGSSRSAPTIRPPRYAPLSQPRTSSSTMSLARPRSARSCSRRTRRS